MKSVKCKDIFRVVIDSSNEREDHDTFTKAIQAIRQRFPQVDYSAAWRRWPDAGNGDRCSELSFGDGTKTLGWLFHIELAE